VIPNGGGAGGPKHNATWSLVKITLPGRAVEPYCILLADTDTDLLVLRFRKIVGTEPIDGSADVLAALEEDLLAKANEMGATRLIAWMEDSFSNFLRVDDRLAITYVGSPEEMANCLFDE
jgi:hypothetical protein